MAIVDLIPRILIERQSFVDITEESLQEEIDNELNLASVTDLVDIPGEIAFDDDSEEDPVEIFNKQTAELTKNINTAMNETSLSLDFVSLLISAVKPTVDKSTMSPHLLKNVPLGSLSSDRLLREDAAVEEARKNQQTASKTGKGWKLQSLNKITTLFRQSCTSLNEQVLKEKEYWNTINLILDNDEVLFKTRINGTRSIGVKYGYGDSGSSYHDKGLALLTKNDVSGEVSFTPITSSLRITEKVYKYIRVRILSEIDNDYMLTGQSIFANKFTTSKHQIINDIEKARYFLFEEDLFYQLTREAKSLINYNVSIISNKIIIEIKNEIIEIESLVYDESNDDELDYQNINNYSSINNNKCQLILNYLKIMLCCYFNYNLKLKQKMPTAVTKWKQSNSHPLILRPLLGNIRHDLNVTNMKAIVDGLIGKFKDQLPESPTVTVEKYINLKTKIGNPFQKSIQKPISHILIVFKNKHNKCLKVKLELTTNEIFVNLIIKLSMIKLYSSENMNDNVDGANVLQMRFNDFNDIEECLEWSIMNFVNE